MNESTMNLSILLLGSNSEAVKNIESFFRKMPIKFEIISGNKNFADSAQKVTGEFVFILDSQLSVPLAEVLVFLTYFYAHPEAQILVGDRFAHKKPPVGNWLNSFARLLFSLSFHDVFCPIKAFRKDASKDILSKLKSTSEVEIFLRARSANIEINSIPVFSHSRKIRSVGAKKFFALIKLLFCQSRWLKE